MDNQWPSEKPGTSPSTPRRSSVWHSSCPLLDGGGGRRELRIRKGGRRTLLWDVGSRPSLCSLLVLFEPLVQPTLGRGRKWTLNDQNVWHLLKWSSPNGWGDGSEGFPGGSDGKQSACNVGDLASIPGLRRSPGEGTGNPLQCNQRHKEKENRPLHADG